jgi:tight adherence protein B
VLEGLLLPGILLLLAFAGGLVILRLDARQRALATRVSSVANDERMSPAEHEEARGIRVAALSGGRLTSLFRTLTAMPVDLDNAHMVPVWIVHAAGLAGCTADYLVARLYFSRQAALAIGIVSGIALIRAIFHWEVGRYAVRLTKQLPDMIELLSSTVMAGLPAIEGLRSAAREMPSPTREELERVVQEISLGASVDVALMNLHRRTGVVEYSILAMTLGVQTRSGGRLVETIQGLAETTRQRLALIARGHALAAEAKLSAYIIAAMPVAGGLLMTAIKPGYMQPLFYDPRGNTMLLLAFGLLGLGVYIMRWMIRGAMAD